MRGIYLKKLILSCLLVVFFCGGVVAIYTYVEKNRLTQEELKRNHMTLLEQVRDKVDLKLSTAMNAVFSLKSRAEFAEYARSDGEDPYVNTIVHQVLISHMDAFFDTGYNIDVLKTNANIVITKDYTVDIDRYMNRIGLDKELLLEGLFSDEDQGYLSVRNLEMWVVEEDLNEPQRDTVHLAFLVNDNQYDDTVFLVTFYIQDLFPQDVQGNEWHAIRIGNDNFVSYPSQADLPIANKNQYVLPSKKLPNWTYHYVPDSSSFQSIGAVQAAFIAMTTIAAGAIFAILIAFRTYRPVQQMLRRVISELTPEKTEYSTPKDEFHAIHSITSSIHRENKDLTSRLHGYRQPLREKLLRDLISGMQSASDAEQELELQQMGHLTQQPMCAALLHETNEFGESLIDQDMVDGIEQIFLTKSKNLQFIKIDNDRQVVLLFHKDKAEIITLLQEVINEVHLKFPIQLTLALGTSVHGILESVSSYHSAVRLLEQLRPMHRKSLLTEEDLEESTGSGYYYPMDLEKELIQSTLQQNDYEVKNILESVIGKTDFLNMDTTVYFQFTYSVQSTLQRIAQQLNCLIGDIFEDPPFSILQQCRTQEEVMESLLLMFKKLMELSEEKNKSLDRMLTDSMDQFIQTHYNEDISLTDLAQYVKMSPSYISSIFKSHMGENFKDYLNSYRVEQAKYLIEQGDCKVSDIAVRVGCNNVNTFIRIFKKSEGVSPGQYIAQKNRV